MDSNIPVKNIQNDEFDFFFFCLLHKQFARNIKASEQLKFFWTEL